MIYAIVEQEFKKTPWCNEIITGIKNEVYKRRVTVKWMDSIDDIIPGNAFSSVLLISGTLSWINENFRKAEIKNLNPIVIGNCLQNSIGLECSCVSADISHTMLHIFHYLHFYNRTKTALFGVNAKSYSDIWRMKVFLGRGYRMDDVFFNNVSLEDTFNHFIQNIEHYDSVICTNDFAAISLMRRLLKKYGNISFIFIISYSDTQLSKKISPSLTSVSNNFHEYGKSAMNIHDIMCKSNEISHIHYFIKGTMHVRESTNNLPDNGFFNDEVKGASLSNVFYQDKEINELVKIEFCLESMDIIDHAIIKEIQNNKTLEEIAADLFISLTSLKYRIKKMCKICGTKSKKELVHILGPYTD